MKDSDSQRTLRRRVDAAERLDELCDDFEAKLRSGQEVEIESFLDRLAEPEHSKVLREMLALELEFRLRAGQTPTLDEYRQRFATHADLVADTFREIEAARAVEENRNSNVGSDELPQVGQPFGRFELREVLGQGGFGTVYRAYDSTLDRDIALKIPRITADEERTEVSRLLREARAAAQVRHPNVVAVHDVGEVEGTYFIATDFIEGKTLRKFLDEGHQFAFSESAALIRKLALALQSAHERRVIHRDIKPGNVILDESDEPYLTDFGLAQRESGNELETQEGTVLGTPAYMSPEQATGNSRLAGASSDIWALGVIMFELLTGERPFTGSSDDVMHDVQHCEPPPPSELDPSVPHGLESICLRCLAKDPSDRYASCREMADELDGWLNIETTHSQTGTTSYAAKSWRRVLVAISVLVLIALSIVGISILVQPTRDQRDDGTRPNAEQPSSQPKLKQEQERTDRDNEAAPQQQPRRHRDVGDNPLRTVAFSPDGSVLATAGTDRAIVIWDTAGSEQWRIRDAHDDNIWSVSFDPVGSLLASASEDGTVKLWDVRSRKNVGVCKHTGPVWCVAFRPSQEEATTFASASSDGTVKIWTADLPAELKSIDVGNSVWAVAFSPDGSLLACGDIKGNIILWDVVENRKILTTHGHEKGVTSVAFSSNLTRFASTGQEGSVKLWTWDRETNEINCDQQLPSHDDGANHVAYSPDGTILSSVGDDHKVRLWDTKAKEEILQIEAHRNPIFSVAFNPSAAILATAGGDGSVRLWKLANNILTQRAVLTHSPGPRLHRDFANAIALTATVPNHAHVADATTKTGSGTIYRFVATDSGYVEFLVIPKTDVTAKLHLHDDDLQRQSNGMPYGVDSHESNNNKRICRVKYEVRAGGVYFVRVSAKDLHQPLRYELKIQPP